MDTVENKIIRAFPLEELNVILGGIRERTIYNFYLNILDTEETDESLKFLTDIGFPQLNYRVVAKIMFRKLADSFGITKLDKNLHLINYPRILKEVYRYFRNIEVAIDSVYKNNNDIYEFLEYFNNNPIIRETQEKIAGVIDNNGSIINFSIMDNESIDDLIGADNPKDFKTIDIIVNANNILFNYYFLIHEKRFHTWYYPFEHLKEKDPKNMILNRWALLLKAIDFDVEPNDENPEMTKRFITRHYSFTKRYDILNEEFEQQHK
ncbi:MAG: hypothetical protein WC644_01780 [Ignavibacteria bacterium]